MILTGKPLIHVMRHIKVQRSIAFEPSANFAVPLRSFESQIRQQLYSEQFQAPLHDL
jgi:hypothetical protein